VPRTTILTRSLRDLPACVWPAPCSRPGNYMSAADAAANKNFCTACPVSKGLCAIQKPTWAGTPHWFNCWDCLGTAFPSQGSDSRTDCSGCTRDPAVAGLPRPTCKARPHPGPPCSCHCPSPTCPTEKHLSAQHGLHGVHPLPQRVRHTGCGEHRVCAVPGGLLLPGGGRLPASPRRHLHQHHRLLPLHSVVSWACLPWCAC